MKRLLILTLIAVSLPAQTKQDLGNRALRGPKVLILDSTGYPQWAVIDAATLVLDPPTTAGGPPTLRAIVPPTPPPAPVVIREKALAVTYGGQPITLPDTPLAGTVVKLYWGALMQRPGLDYTVVGAVVTLLGTGWTAGDPLLITYFW